MDVANRLLRSLSRQRPRDRLTVIAAGLSPHVTLTFDEGTGAPRLAFGLSRRSGDAESQRRSLEEVVERLAAEAERGERVAVVLDEFQAIRRFGGEPMEWHLRDLIQRHGQVSFVCAGSEGIGALIVDRAGPRTQDILQVARHVHSLGLARGEARVGDVEEAILDVVREEDPVIRAMWLDLTAHQQNVLRAVACEVDQLFASATRIRFGLPTSSSVAGAVDALEGRGLLVRQDGTIVFDSPFVRRWVEREAIADVPPEAVLG